MAEKKISATSVINPVKPAPIHTPYTPTESYIQGPKKTDKKSSDKKLKIDNKEKSDKSEKKTEKSEKKIDKSEKKTDKSVKSEKKSISEKPAAVKKTLQGYSFVFTGTHSVVRKALQELVETNGGVFADTVSKAINYLIATQTEVEVGTNKVVKASKYNLPIVSEDFLHNCIKQGKVIDHTHYGYSAGFSFLFKESASSFTSFLFSRSFTATSNGNLKVIHIINFLGATSRTS